MDKEQNTQVYRLIYPIWVGYFIMGSLVVLIFSALIKIQVIDRIHDDMDSVERVGLPIILFLFLMYGVYFYLSPFYAKLTITENGYVYQTLALTITALWTESIIIGRKSIFFGKSGLLLPLSPNIKLSRIAKYIDHVNVSRGIPLGFYGEFTSKKLRQNIRYNAPYLFGALYTDQDFTKTVNAINVLVENYLKKIFRKMYSVGCIEDIIFDIFYMARGMLITIIH